VLYWSDGLSSLATSLSMTVKLLKGRVDVTALSQFQEVEAELELLWFGCNAALMEDQVEALWILACPASDLLVLHVFPLVSCGTTNGVGE
jgi:hypothetical protein